MQFDVPLPFFYVGENAYNTWQVRTFKRPQDLDAFLLLPFDPSRDIQEDRQH
jgi:hypothetical protein